jgi:hypothetical protein
MYIYVSCTIFFSLYALANSPNCIASAQILRVNGRNGFCSCNRPRRFSQRTEFVGPIFTICKRNVCFSGSFMACCEPTRTISSNYRYMCDTNVCVSNVAASVIPRVSSYRAYLKMRTATAAFSSWPAVELDAGSSFSLSPLSA